MASSQTVRGRHVERSALTALLPVAALLPFWLLAMVVIWLPIRLIVDVPVWSVPLAWLLLGAILFVPPIQVAVLSPLFGAREPTDDEAAVIAPIWRDLAMAANLPSYRYVLRVVDSAELNAYVWGVTWSSSRRSRSTSSPIVNCRACSLTS